jgi:hypothetical protein
MLNNILKLEGAELLSNNEQKKVSGGAVRNTPLCRCLKADYYRLLSTASNSVFDRFMQNNFFNLVRCGILD